ncbi:hypothetical protein [Sediminibacterium sp.]|uniref:hypothetical protein n=1 Tax=Sediminibacterium sp. TaxID=1917865 RepID=UPI0027368F5F|nr:hypothetical protein [Sediminibacterium sp.]MDP3393082.1 hypothetical protein [Sediminibacterium sp.]MDP3567684.1 hypothetical protein [Sediminibacterium sp.]
MNSSGRNGFWWDLAKDFLLPLVLGVFAGYMAYYIFVKETKRDRVNDEAKKAEERSDKLKYFSALVESALRTSIQQKNNLKNQIKAIRQNNVEFQLMTQVPLYDLKRISEELNLEDYLLAYTNIYSQDRTASVKEFKNTIAAIDYLYDVFQHIIIQLKDSQMYDYQRKKKLQEIYENGWNLSGRLMLYFQRNDPQSYSEFLQLYQNFMQNHQGDNYDLQFYNDFFFVPFNDFCTTYMADNRRIIPEILELGIFTRDGKQSFNQVKSENDIVKNDLIGDFKIIYSSLMELRDNSERLLADF